MDEKNGIDRETKRPIVTPAHFLTLRFQDHEGREVEVETAVTQGRWESANTHDPVEVWACLGTGLGSIGTLFGLAGILCLLRK